MNHAQHKNDAAFRKQLIALGVEKLADIILSIADQEMVDDYETRTLRERITASGDENREAFLERLATFSETFDPYAYEDEMAEYAQELRDILLDLCFSEDDPFASLVLLSEVYKLGDELDDEQEGFDPEIDLVFQHQVVDTYAQLARKCPDSQAVREHLFSIIRQDEWQVAQHLCAAVGSFLPNDQIKALYQSIEQTYRDQKAKKEADPVWYLADDVVIQSPDFLVECMKGCAKSLRDGDLYLRLHQLIDGDESLKPASIYKVAEVYAEGEQYDLAVEWLDKIPEGNVTVNNYADELRIEIGKATADRGMQQTAAQKIFLRQLTTENLDRALAHNGQEQKQALLEQAWRIMEQDKWLNSDNLVFLLEQGKHNLAAAYVQDRKKELGNIDDYSVEYIAQSLAKGGHPLIACLIYRTRLSAILARGQTHEYEEGAGYLHALERLAKQIKTWQGEPTHKQYYQQIYEAHRRKRSFWAWFKG